MYRCICGKEYHNKHSFNAHKARCKIYQGELFKVLNKHLTEDFLKWWFYKKHKSSNQLAILLNAKYGPELIFNVGKIINYCKGLNIKTWSVKESNNLPHILKIRHESNNLAFGTPGYIKRQKTLAKEGIVNVFQRESVKEKIKQTMLDKYGVPNPVYMDSFKSNNCMESKPHLKVIEFLEKIGFVKGEDFLSESNNYLMSFNDELNKSYCPRPDIIFPDKRVIIEIYGDRWHAHPTKYKETDIINTWYGNLTAKDIWERDSIRERHIKKLGYDLIILWESEINKNDFQKILNYEF